MSSQQCPCTHLQQSQSSLPVIERINMAASGARVLIYGGRGALGSSLVKHFKAEKWVSIPRTILSIIGSRYPVFGCVSCLTVVFCISIPKPRQTEWEGRPLPWPWELDLWDAVPARQSPGLIISMTQSIHIPPAHACDSPASAQRLVCLFMLLCLGHFLRLTVTAQWFTMN